MTVTASNEPDRPAGATSIVNVEMARAWDGESEHWAQWADHYDADVREHTHHLMTAAAIDIADRVLDIGCGCGGTTIEAARRAASGSVLGVDISARMIERARERSQARGIGNIRFEFGDAQVYPFEEQAFDVAISRFGAMFFRDPVAAFRNIARALRPDGRLAMLTWQPIQQNPWMLALRDALAVGRALPEPPIGQPGPFSLAEADTVRRILNDAGLSNVEARAIHEPVRLGGDPDDAYAYISTMGVTRGLLEGLEADDRARALTNLRDMLSRHTTADGIEAASSAWLITAHRP